MRLTEHEREILDVVVRLHEERGDVVMHEKMRQADREALCNLALAGLVEFRPMQKDQPIEQRPVVPTPMGRELVSTPKAA